METSNKGTAVICVDHLFGTLEFFYAVLRLYESGFKIKIAGPEKDHIYYGERIPTEWKEEKEGNKDRSSSSSPLEMLHPMVSMRDLLDRAFIGGAYPCHTTDRFSDIDASDVKVLFVPGGLGLGDRLRRDNDFLRLLTNVEKKKDCFVAVLGHSVWAAISAGIVKGRNVTSMPSMREDVQNAGGKFQDIGFVSDGKLLTAQTPLDLPKLMRFIDTGKH